MTPFIDTASASSDLRARMINVADRSISLTNFATSAQLDDLQTPPNCHGFGRVHTFVEEQFDDWPSNPLPIRPARHRLGLPASGSLPAQVFQCSGCNWRCWYCFVPFADLTARRGQMVPVRDMVAWSLSENAGRCLVDLTGGQPDLTPEWPLWFLEELDAQDSDRVFVWSDDNLSTDYLWRFLTHEQLDWLGDHPRYGRACCIKGYDAESFSFNTLADPSMFDYQFDLLRRLRETTRIDYYVYLTITSPTTESLTTRMRLLVDRLQDIHEVLPLRCIPLKVLEWGPVSNRLTPDRERALANQLDAVYAWRTEIDRRFPGVDATIETVPR